MTSKRYSNSYVSNVLIKKKSLALGILLFLTLFFSVFASNLSLDSSGFSYDSVDPDAFEAYQKFKNSFGGDEPVIIAVNADIPVTDGKIQDAIAKTTQALKRLDGVTTVINLSSLNTDALKSLLRIDDFWTRESISKLKAILPGVFGLVSSDLKIVTFAVEFSNVDQNGFIFHRRLNTIENLIKVNFPGNPDCHFIGYPVLKAAFERHNAMNTIFYVCIGLIVGTIAALYIFKSLRVSSIVLISSMIATVWTVGVSALSGLELTIMSGIGVCFIIIVSTTTVMHIVSKFYELIRRSPDHVQALKETLSIVLRPCFMCAMTTSVGFASLAISPVKMIRDSGLMISIGVLSAFIIALVISVNMLSRFSPPRPEIFKKINSDLMTVFLRTGLCDGLKHPGRSVWVGFTLLIFFGAGACFVEKSKEPFFTVAPKTSEAKSFTFLENKIKAGYPVSIVIDSVDKNISSSLLWMNLFKYEQQIKMLPFIQRTDSLAALVYYLSHQAPLNLISNERIINGLISHKDIQDVTRAFINPDTHQIRIMFHIPANEASNMDLILKQLEKEANTIFKQTAKISFNGLLILQERQKNTILIAQMHSLALALGLITLLMMIQLKSFTLGFISLIPNIFPLLTMFGIMGWFNIALDPLIIFAAIVSFGLSVDDTIHFLTQLKREILIHHSDENIRPCLESSFQITSRALLSTTCVLFFSSLSFLLSSFSHVFVIGLLIASASATALYADLVILPALILKFTPFHHILLKKRKKDSHGTKQYHEI